MAYFRTINPLNVKRGQTGYHNYQYYTFRRHFRPFSDKYTAMHPNARWKSIVSGLKIIKKIPKNQYFLKNFKYFGPWHPQMLKGGKRGIIIINITHLGIILDHYRSNIAQCNPMQVEFRWCQVLKLSKKYQKINIF